MRALTVLVALVAALAGSVGAYAAIRAVGPDDRTNEFGYGEGATVAPGGGDLFQSRNFARVVAALERELGPDAPLESLSVSREQATAIAQLDGRLRYVDVDASGRSRARDSDRAEPAALIRVSLIDAAAIDRLVRAAEEQAGAPVEDLSLFGNREWSISMDGGEPDRFLANLDGGGLRIPGEPNPEPVGEHPDSLLRAANLERVFEAAQAEAQAGARVRSLDIRPDSVRFTLVVGSRELALDYGYEAVLASRDLRAKVGPDSATVAFEELDAGAVERMASAAEKRLADVEFVTLSSDATKLSMHFLEGSAFVDAGLDGR